MTAPAQMIGSASVSLTGAGVPQSAPNLSPETISDSEETSFSDDFFQAVFREDDAPSNRSGFGAILSQYVTPQSSMARFGQNDRMQASQPRVSNLDSNLLATVPVQPSEKARDVAPLTLANPWSKNEENETDSSSNSQETAGMPSRSVRGTPSSPRKVKTGASSDEAAAEIADQGTDAPSGSSDNTAIRIPGKAERRAADRESSSVPQSDQTGPAPDWLKTAVLSPELFRLELLKPDFSKFDVSKLDSPKPDLSKSDSSKVGSPQPAGDAASTPDLTQPDESATQDDSADAPSLAGQQSPAAPSGALAFAVRLTPPDTAPPAGDDAAANVSDTSSGSPQTVQKQMQASDAVASLAQTTGEKGESGAPGDQLLNTNLTPLPTQIVNQSASPSEPALMRSEARANPEPSLARAEPVTEPPAAPASSNRDFTVRIPDATDRGTNVRFVERGSEVHVSVRTGDEELAQMLRGGLSDLTGRLQHGGLQAEVWRPGADPSQSDPQNQSDSQNQAGDPNGSAGRRNQSGAQRDGQDQPSENKPRWVEELETSIGEPATRAGS
jgi:hypothetical protein